MTNLNVPFQIPGYRIVRRLGVGGMATVYLAVQESLKRPVAVKVLATERAPSDELAQRFEHEARTIARLDHPHIVSIYDVGRTSNGQIYYTMPYFPNGDLSMRNLRDQPRRVLEIMRALTEALACAHDKGIVHRDVKPENVLFDKQDRPQLADFGIALSHSHQPRMTREGATIGSSGYMSPEQARGQPLDGRSDFYSLGVVCYELLTGERPFQGADALAVALAHIEKPVPRLPVTRRLWQPLVDRALAKQPDARFQSAEELLAAIAVVERRLKMRRRRGASRYWVWLIERIQSVSRGKRALALGLGLAVVLAAVLALLPRFPRTANDSSAAQVNAPSALDPAEIAATDGRPPSSPVGDVAGAPPVTGEPIAVTGSGATPEAAAIPADRAEQLRLAASLVLAGHLTSPAGNNAAERYLALIAADEQDRDA
ncbi:MAG: serine/threonine-protein kinase, partial [Dokdonella sp.]|uniref:serine/threonine-protein kinase n=1 Tax=Dokdonella sp. TaxID=2291710 RepID=UPI0032636B45